SDLQQHYTPQAVAERMLTLLPLERLRPEERVIFDPAAGSGSLLLAATRRLAAMPDVAMLPDPRNYLAHHVIGNDRDPNAKLITKLRYTLVQETLGQQGLFPDPKYFKEDYREANAWTHSLRPRVIVANPPFAEDDDVQRAARFVKIVLEKLQEGDQFAVVLPQIFLTGSTHGWPEVRQLLSQRCHILEAWQLPEGVIGLSSQESVCVVLGIVEKSSIKGTLARAIVSRARKDIIRDQGFLGQTWIAEIEPDTDDWDSISAPSLESQKPTIPLRNLFYVCSGVTPQKGISPISYQPDGVVVKRYWKNIWRKQGLWANPANIPFNERYIRYGPEYLYRDSSKNEWVYDSEKVLVSRVTNRAAKYPLSVCIDTIGLCPNNNIFCIVPLSPAVSAISSEMKKPEGWERLENKSQLLWLLGVLSSDLAARLSTRGRSARQINSNMIRDFGLPARVDYRIIELTEAIIQGEMSHLPKAKLNMLREELNEVVEVSYGKFNPSITLTRTGPLPDLDKWQQEKKLPSLTVTGQVLDFDAKRNKIQLYLDSLLDEAQEAWVSLPQELPGWALDGTVFEAQLSRTVETLDDLDQRPWALRNFKHTPRPYLTLEELQERLLTKLGQES
ncbi:MAG: N-6 DNA methylase, partial [Chloroflexota bacterium]|nr:N-6 DNA methylase [Chloroflexota bacterium]